MAKARKRANYYWLGYITAKGISLMRYENGKGSSRYRSHLQICSDMLGAIEHGQWEATGMPDVSDLAPMPSAHDNAMYWRGAVRYLRYIVY